MRKYESLLVCLMAASCSPDTKTSAVALPPAQESTMKTSAGPAAKPNAESSTCPHTGKWALCSVETRLRQSGFVAKRLPGKPSKRPGFSVTPAVYKLGSGRLEVFIYDDAAAMARDMAAIDTLTVAPRGVASPWEGTPVLIRAGNLAAVLITDNSSQIERLTLALTAGAPQPGSPR